MQNYDSQKNINKNNTFVAVTAVLLAILVVVNLVGTNVLSTQGVIVSEVETRTLALEKENQQLSVKIEEATTLSQLEETAQQRGYVSSKSIVFAPSNSTFASR